jgi:uncharacterized protein DUF6527
MKLRPQIVGEQTIGYCFWCVACKSLHPFRISHYADAPGAPLWTFNGDFERPTFAPSLRLHRTQVSPECHVTITNGEIQYHNDCDHDMKGKKILIPDIPEGW